MILELVKDKIRINYNGMQWSSEYYDKGGRETRNPKNGETIITKPKWTAVNGGCYNSRISDAINSCIRYHVYKEHEGELIGIKDYVNAIESLTQEVFNTLDVKVDWQKHIKDSGGKV